jgi:hypothetical protein
MDLKHFVLYMEFVIRHTCLILYLLLFWSAHILLSITPKCHDILTNYAAQPMLHKLWRGGDTPETTWHSWFPHASPAPCCYFIGSGGISDMNQCVNVVPSNYTLQMPFGPFYIQVIHVWWNWKPVAMAPYIHLYSLQKHYKCVLVTLSLPLRTFSWPSLSIC